jgi:peroxiredoxin
MYDVVQQDFAGLKGYNTAKRSVFILDATGTVRFKWVSDDPGKEPDYDEIKKQLGQI